MNMRIIAAALSALSVTPAQAGLITADWSWTGDAGWRAAGVVTWDPTIAFPAAAGISGGFTSNGIDYLSGAIWNHTGLLIGAWDQVVAGVVVANHTQITLDSAQQQFAAGSTLWIGPPDSTATRFASVFGAGAVIIVNSRYRDAGPDLVPLSVRAPDPDPPPTIAAPAPLGLLALGLLALAGVRRRAARG
jgi:MYXO-CTERM domain-containing protein